MHNKKNPKKEKKIITIIIIINSAARWQIYLEKQNHSIPYENSHFHITDLTLNGNQLRGQAGFHWYNFKFE